MSRLDLVKAGNVRNHLFSNQIQTPSWLRCILLNSLMLYGAVLRINELQLQPSFGRCVSFWLGHLMQMFSLNKVRTWAAVNRVKENKKQKICLARDQQIALCWPTIVYTHLFCRELWGGYPGNSAQWHCGCSTQYSIVTRVSVHVLMYVRTTHLHHM